jgi:hypothetical protein
MDMKLLAADFVSHTFRSKFLFLLCFLIPALLRSLTRCYGAAIVSILVSASLILSFTSFLKFSYAYFLIRAIGSSQTTIII